MDVEDPQHRASAIARAPPDGGYGWVCVLAQFLINGFTWGVAASYGVYLAHYLSHDLFPAARPLDYALIGGLNFAAALLAGAGLLAAGFLAASFASEVWHLYLKQGAAVGAGIGLLYVPVAAAVVPQWFAARRGFANGIAAAGTGFGGVVACLATAAMLEALGLARTLQITAGVVLVVNLVATVLMRSRHQEVQSDLRIFNLQVLASYQARLLIGWSVVVMFGYITLMFSLSDYALTIGKSSKESATVTALLNLGATIGRPILGYISDRFGRVQVACILTLSCSVLVFTLWLPSTSYSALIVFTITGGAIIGIFWTVITPLAADIVGLKELPVFLNFVWLSVVLPSLFAEVIALQLKQPLLWPRSYVYAQIFAGGSYLVSGAILMELWRVRSKETTSVRTSQPEESSVRLGTLSAH